MTQEFKVQLLQGFAIKAEFQASIFFGQFGLENGYIKKSKLSLRFTLKFTWIHLLCFTLVLIYLLSNLAMQFDISQAMRTYFTEIQHCITVILGIRLELKQASRVTPSPYVLEFINAYLFFLGAFLITF
jgi:hypothetical protein